MRYIYCAQCGEKLEIHRKAVPSKGKVYDIIRPHNCDEAALEDMSEEVIKKIAENEMKMVPPKLEQMFNSFKFVKKLNSFDQKLEIEPHTAEAETGDKRSKEHLRKEIVTSMAPSNLLKNIKNLPTSQPESDINVEPKGD